MGSLALAPSAVWPWPGPPGRAARRDRAFEQVVRAFRDALLRALAEEPASPARHLRAYLRCVCDSALPPPARTLRHAGRLLAQPEYQAIWLDFAAEACAGDAVDGALSEACRAVAERLWLDQAAGSSFTWHHVTSVRDYLLHLCDAAAPAPHPPTA